MLHADMKEYSWRKYRTEPYLATVCLRVTHALDHLAAGADSMTSYYGFLPDFIEPMWRSIQNYREQVIKRIEEWDIIQEQIDKPYIPPIVVGWDASPCEGKHFRDIQGMYPFTPITAWNEITESVALLLKILLDGSVDNSYLAKIRELRDEYGF